MTGLRLALARFASGTGPIVVGVAVVAIAAAFFRAVGVPKWHTVWAEDGSIFAACAYHQALPSCLATAYQGYLHVGPRIVAAVAVLVDPRDLPLALTAGAAVVDAIAAALAARAIAAATGSRSMGLLAGAGLALVYQAGREVGGNLANAHAELFAAAAMVLIAQWLGRPCGFADWLLVAVTGLTSPLAPSLPVIAGGALIVGTRRSRQTLIVTALAAAPQLVAELINHRSVIGQPVTLLRMVGGFYRYVVMQGFYGPAHPWLGQATFVAVLVLAAWLGLRAVERLRAQGVTGLPESWPAVTTLALIGLAFADWVVDVEVNGAIAQRYAYQPAALLIAALAISVSFTARTSSGRITVPGRRTLPTAVVTLGAAAVIGVAFAATFRVDALSSIGPDATAEIRGLASCPTGSDALVKISPIQRSWFVPIPCQRLGP
jgi:hypothetical protein